MSSVTAAARFSCPGAGGQSPFSWSVHRLVCSCCSKTSQVCECSVLFSHLLWFPLRCSHTLELCKWHNLLLLSPFLPPFAPIFQDYILPCKLTRSKRPHLLCTLLISAEETVPSQSPLGFSRADPRMHSAKRRLMFPFSAPVSHTVAHCSTHPHRLQCSFAAQVLCTSRCI